VAERPRSAAIPGIAPAMAGTGHVFNTRRPTQQRIQRRPRCDSTYSSYISYGDETWLVPYLGPVTCWLVWSTRRTSLSYFALSSFSCSPFDDAALAILSPNDSLAASALVVDILRHSRRSFAYLVNCSSLHKIRPRGRSQFPSGAASHPARSSSSRRFLGARIYIINYHHHGVDSVWEISCEFGNSISQPVMSNVLVAWATRGACVRLIVYRPINRTFVAIPLFPCAM
jgi:hypothetical protein